MARDRLSYINLAHISFLEEVYEQYLQDPFSVDPSWHGFFSGWEWAKQQPQEEDCTRVFSFIQNYRAFGFKKARGGFLQERQEILSEIDFLDDMDRSLIVPTFGCMPEPQAPLGDIIDLLEDRYGKGIGWDVDHTEFSIKQWIYTYVEGSRYIVSDKDKDRILEDLYRAEMLEKVLHKKYPGQIRFSLEGGETLLPMLRFLLEKSHASGKQEAIIAMTHRGRLNVLANIFHRPITELLEEGEVEGDIKTHQGQVHTLSVGEGSIRIDMPANPSHLESIIPVALGKVRGRQEELGDVKAVIGVCIHGDAALSGQGVVYETLQMQKLPGYSVGGTIHIVVNNQIGYTTSPSEGRSTLHCTDIAKSFGCPILHVDADRPLECIEAVCIAMQIRDQFGVDVFIDMTCYRKWGHNEGDDPTYTQPVEYNKIQHRLSIYEQVKQQWVDLRWIEMDLQKQKEEKIASQMQILSSWEKPSKRKKQKRVPPVKKYVLDQAQKGICFIPNDLTLHSKLQGFIHKRQEAFSAGKNIDWAFAEALALGSLLLEKIPVRLSGQDVKRGTFSQRHAVWVDQVTGKEYIPLQHIGMGQEAFSLYNSPLSELGVMGFDLGYSLGFSRSLVIWEAQYGDFCNGAQVMIDQYISSLAQKWNEQSRFTLFLPHGYEGRGPEHSSARIERFLQLCALGNMRVVQPTTPAQLFHLLRLQAYSNNISPLVVFSPKMLLRHPACVSSLQDLIDGTFHGVIDDFHHLDATRIILCSGKVFYELEQEIRKRERNGVALVRIEQLYPFPFDVLQKVLQKYAHVQEVLWVQEEPKNMGCYEYMQKIWRESFSSYLPLHYVGREESGSPATGSLKEHQKQQQILIDQALR